MNLERRWINAFGLPLVFVAVFALMGGHWAVLQSVAWAQMIRDYTAAEGSLAAAVEKTFSGKAPCGLCVKVAEGRQAEDQRAPVVKAEKKIEGFLTGPAVALIAPVGREWDFPEWAFVLPGGYRTLLDPVPILS